MNKRQLKKMRTRILEWTTERKPTWWRGFYLRLKPLQQAWLRHMWTGPIYQEWIVSKTGKRLEDANV